MLLPYPVSPAAIGPGSVWRWLFLRRFIVSLFSAKLKISAGSCRIFRRMHHLLNNEKMTLCLNILFLAICEIDVF